jgi:hypothetical protein
MKTVFVSLLTGVNKNKSLLTPVVTYIIKNLLTS